MTASGFPGTINAPAAPVSGNASTQFAVESRNSAPVQRPRRSVESSRREAADPAYRARKRAARAALMAEIAQGEPFLTLGEVRLARGLSQQDLANLTGLTQSHIAKIEARKLAIQLATAQKIAQAVELSIDQLAPLVLPPEGTSDSANASVSGFSVVDRIVTVERK